MKSLLFPLMFAMAAPTWADEMNPTNQDLTAEIVWRYEHLRSATDLQMLMQTVHVLADRVQESLDARRELVAIAHGDSPFLKDLILLGEESEACRNDDVRFLIYSILRADDIPLLLAEAEKPGLSAPAVINLLSVFRNWYFRDKEISNRIRGTLNVIEANFKNDGHFLGLPIAPRVYSEQEAGEVFNLIQLLRAKNLAKYSQ